MPSTREPEVTVPCALTDGRGRLRREAIGWARQPLWSCGIPGSRGRRKQWNYWAVMGDRFFFALTLADVDYLSLAVATFLPFDTRALAERVVPSFLSRALELAEDVTGSIRFDAGGLRIGVDDDGGSVRLAARYVTRSGDAVDADIRVRRLEGRDSLNVVVPWTGSGRRFQMTSKQIGLPAEGHVTLNRETFTLGAGAFASLDFGRGVWPYRTRWNWAAASGVTAGREVALNLGGQWTRGTGMTENGVVVGGRLHKIGEEVAFDWDPKRPDAPWHIHDGGHRRVDLVFTPFHTRHVHVPAVVLASELQHALGTFEGSIVLDDGERLAIRGLRGWAEEHDARW